MAGLDKIGGPLAYSHYATGWAQASNTPLRWYKYHTHGGGVRDPLIVSWPGRLERPGAVLTQFHHIIDIAPTVYEIADIDPPSEYRGVPQMPIHGKNFAFTLTDPDAPTVKHSQYFEMFGNRGIWMDGWKAVTHHKKGAEYNESEWELYHLDKDFSEAHNLATEHPEKLRELEEMWWFEAGRYDVLPLDDRSVELFRAPPNPRAPSRRERFDHFPPVSHIEPSAAPPIEPATAYRIECLLSGEKSGVIVCYGNIASGFVLYADDGALRYEYNAAGDVMAIESELPDDDPLLAGFEFRRVDTSDPGGPGRGRLMVDGDAGGPWVDIPNPLTFLSLSGMDIGHNPLSALSNRYTPPFPFVGDIEQVTFHLRLPEATDTRKLDD